MRNNIDVIRAWKDPKYRATLSEEELRQLPQSPIEDALSEVESMSILGGDKNPSQGFLCTVSSESPGGGCCNPFYTWKRPS